MREYLKELRKIKRLTQLEVAKKLDISESYYNQIENGERQTQLKASILVGLSNVFNISVDELLRYEQVITEN